MLRIIKKYFVEKWWLPTLVFLIFTFLFYATLEVDFIPSNFFLFFGIILLFISGVAQLMFKKWLAGFLNLAISVITVFVGLFFIAVFLSLFGPDTDTFADNLELPKNVELDKPIDLLNGDDFELLRPESSIQRQNLDFQLYASFQPGLYEYDVWIDTEMNGIAYLKVFEITQEVQLSKSRLTERSSIRIENAGGELKKFETNDHFTIYEGDWGKPYGARFELWFKPDGKSTEKKLLEKNYVVEGWMR